MNNHQENKITMVKRVGDKLKENIIIWQTNTPMVNAVNEMISLRDQLETQVLIQIDNTKGVAMSTKDLKEIMISKAIDVGGVVRGYAFDINDKKLAEQLNYSKSKIINKRDMLAVEDCKHIYDIANNLVATKPIIATYQINAAKLADLKTSIDNYKTAIDTPRQATDVGSGATKKIKELIKKFDNLLNNRIDNLMLMYRVTNPDFYEAYVQSRMIIDLGIRHEPETPGTPA